jgi:hypothetical protein
MLDFNIALDPNLIDDDTHKPLLSKQDTATIFLLQKDKRFGSKDYRVYFSIVDLCCGYNLISASASPNHQSW